MMSRDEVIMTLSKKYDPRSVSWEFRAILDVLQDEEPATVKELETAICRNYGCDLFTYKQLYDGIQALVKQKVILSNPITKKYTVASEYKTKNVTYLPISTYSVVLFTLSVLNFMATFALKRDYTLSLIIILIGALYLFAQYMGSEFKPGNGWKQFVPKHTNNGKKLTPATDTVSKIRKPE